MDGKLYEKLCEQPHESSHERWILNSGFLDFENRFWNLEFGSRFGFSEIDISITLTWSTIRIWMLLA